MHTKQLTYTHVPGSVTARFTVTIVPGVSGSSQVTANPDDDTAVGVKVMMLVSVPFVLLVKMTTNPIAVLFAPTGSVEMIVTPAPLKTPVLFVDHLRNPLEVQVHILC